MIDLRRHPIVEDFLAAIEAEPLLDGGRGKHWWFGSSSAPLTTEALATWLAQRSAYGADQAVNELMAYLSRDTYPARCWLALGGIQVPESFSLSSTIALEPFDEAAFFGELFPEVSRGMTRRATQRITARLSALIEIPKCIVDDRPPPESISEATSRGFAELDVARSCLSLVGPSLPVSIGRGSQPEPQVPGSPAATLGWGHDFRYFEPTSFDRPMLEEAKTLLAAYESLDDKARRALEVPMSRFQSALGQTRTVDAAIDLGIALESIFANDVGQITEISYRLRTRAARFVTPDHAQRSAARDFFGDLYGLRSDAAHRGQFSRRKGSEVQEVIGEGCRRTAAI